MRVLGLNGWVALLSLVAIAVSSVALYRFSSFETGAVPEGNASPTAVIEPQERTAEVERLNSSSVAPKIDPTGSLSAGHATRNASRSYRPDPPKRIVSYRDDEEVIEIGAPIPVDTGVGLKDTSSGEVVNIGPFIPVDDAIGLTDDSSDEVVNIGPDLPVPEG